MKRIILTFAGSVIIGLTALLAQDTDQTQNNSNATQQNNNQSTQDQQQNSYPQSPVQGQQQPQLNQQQNNTLQTDPPPQTTPQQTVPRQQTYPDPQDQYQSPYPNQNQIMVQPTELPSTMQQTLQGRQYRGWENSTIYRDRTTGEYSLQLREGNETPRIYRFDRNGRVIDEANKPTQTIRGTQGVRDIDQ